MKDNFSSNCRNISRRMQMCIILTLLLLFGCNQNKTINRSEKWIEDLNNFSQYLPKLHKNLYFNLSEKEFKQRINVLKSRVDSLSDKEILFSLMKIISSIGDAHTNIGYNSWEFNYIPIYTYVCDNGLLIGGAIEQYKYLIGKKLLKINGVDVENIQDTLQRFIPHENKFWLKYKIPEYICNTELLKFTNIIDTLDTIKITYMDNGKVTDIKIIPIQSNYLSSVKMIYYYDYFNIELPLSMRADNKRYWYHYFNKEQAIYFQYNQCVNMPFESFSYFSEKFFKFISQNLVKSIIIDVRFNTGGNSNLFSCYFSPKLKSFVQQNDVDIYTLIGRRTFSSGQWVAIEMKKEYNSILIGEPSGNKPNSYGDYRTFSLPNSKLAIGYSVNYWKMLDSEDDALYPDIPVKIESKDILTGRDKCLERAFELINSSEWN